MEIIKVKMMQCDWELLFGKGKKWILSLKNLKGKWFVISTAIFDLKNKTLIRMMALR